MSAKIVPPPKHPPSRSYEKGKVLSARAQDLIPGGAHTYAKGDDQYPEQSPKFIARGKGCHVWDVDGNEFIEYAMGLRAVTLGHAWPSVVEAAQRAMLDGVNFNRPAPVEVECAERFLGLIRKADMVKFTKDGSAALDAGLKLARAWTGRDIVAICGDHPFFSSSDWFIGSTAIPGGIPEWTREHTVKFQYNNLASVEALFDQYPNRIACVVLEPARNVEPADNFLAKLKELCHRRGALLMLDEMITGFRWHKNGAQHVYDIEPDISCFGKALANGFALSALSGKREILEQGGIRGTRERVFLLSTTHGAETHALAAAIAVMKVYEQEPVIETLYARGERLRAGINRAVSELKMERQFSITGRPCCLFFGTADANGAPDSLLRTLFMQEMLKRGVLAPSFVMSYSHSEADIDHTIDAVAESLWVYRKALEDGVERYLVGQAVKSVYRKFS
jgi:glutamate-1-semialdehyde 2,1-aminomutase